MSDKPLNQQIEEMHQDTIAGISELSAKIELLAKKQNNNQVSNVNSDQERVGVFFRNSLKFYRYAGSLGDFKKSKKIGSIAFLVFILLGLLTTIITSISAKIYTTFTFFENIALIIFAVFGARYFNVGNEVQDIVVSKASVNKFARNKDNLCYPINKTKSWVKAANIFVIAGVILNIIYIWFERSNIALIATILEVLFCASEVVLYFSLNIFYNSYLLVTYKGKNSRGENVAIVQDTMLKKFFTLEEHKEKFSFLYK